MCRFGLLGDIRSFLCLESIDLQIISKRSLSIYSQCEKKKKRTQSSPKSSGQRPSLADMTWKSGHLSGFRPPEGTFVVVLLQHSCDWGATLDWQQHCPSPKITEAEGTGRTLVVRLPSPVQTRTNQTTTKCSKCPDARVIFIPKTLYCVYLNIIYHVHIPKVLRSILHGWGWVCQRLPTPL